MAFPVPSTSRGVIWQMMSVWPVPGEVGFEHLVKVVSAVFINCDASVLPDALSKRRDAWRLHKYPSNGRTLPTNLSLP